MFCFCCFVIVQSCIPQNICMISTFCGLASLAWLMMGHFFFLSPQREKKRIEGISTWYMFKCKRALSWKMVCSWTAGHEIWIYFIQNAIDSILRVFSVYTANVYRDLRFRFFLQYLWKRAVRITKKPYTPQRERLCMLWGNPVIFTALFHRYCRENLWTPRKPL